MFVLLIRLSGRYWELCRIELVIVEQLYLTIHQGESIFDELMHMENAGMVRD